MINTRLKAEDGSKGIIRLVRPSGECVATFESAPFFYIVTGFKTAEAYNTHHEEKPTTFLVWKREH